MYFFPSGLRIGVMANMLYQLNKDYDDHKTSDLLYCRKTTEFYVAGIAR